MGDPHLIVAVFGSRPRFAPEHDRVVAFVDKLVARGYTIMSGGAPGVDTWAEQRALERGARVISLRPVKFDGGGPVEDSWGIERWELGIAQPYRQRLPWPPHPTFADFASAAIYRDALIAEEAARGIAFHYANSPGTAGTIAFFEALEKPVHRFTKEDHHGTES